MNFLADENIDSAIVDALRSSGHAVRYVVEFNRGWKDEEVFDSANGAGELLITADKDFGEIVFRQKRITMGVLLVRLSGLSPQTKAAAVLAVVQEHGEDIEGKFTVIMPGSVRIRRSLA